MKKMISRLPEAKTKIPMPINPRGNNHRMKYEDLRPCTVEGRKGRFHRFFMTKATPTSKFKWLYAIVEFRNGKVAEILISGDTDDDGFRFTDHNKEEEDNDKTT